MPILTGWVQWVADGVAPGALEVFPLAGASSAAVAGDPGATDPVVAPEAVVADGPAPAAWPPGSAGVTLPFAVEPGVVTSAGRDTVVHPAAVTANAASTTARTRRPRIPVPPRTSVMTPIEYTEIRRPSAQVGPRTVVERPRRGAHEMVIAP